jgi:hypothetical protein
MLLDVAKGSTVSITGEKRTIRIEFVNLTRENLTHTHGEHPSPHNIFLLFSSSWIRVTPLEYKRSTNHGTSQGVAALAPA